MFRAGAKSAAKNDEGGDQSASNFPPASSELTQNKHDLTISPLPQASTALDDCTSWAFATSIDMLNLWCLVASPALRMAPPVMQMPEQLAPVRLAPVDADRPSSGVFQPPLAPRVTDAIVLLGG